MCCDQILCFFLSIQHHPLSIFLLKHSLIIFFIKIIFFTFCLNIFNYNEKYSGNFFFCPAHLQTPDLTFWKNSYLIYTHWGQCPLILFLSPCNSFFIICGEDNSLCPSSGISVLKSSFKQKYQVKSSFCNNKLFKYKKNMQNPKDLLIILLQSR